MKLFGEDKTLTSRITTSDNSPLVPVSTSFSVRVKQLGFWIVGAGSVLTLHSNMLHLGETWNDRIMFVFLVLMALNHSVVEKT